jgi:aminopeptidase N
VLSSFKKTNLCSSPSSIHTFNYRLGFRGAITPSSRQSFVVPGLRGEFNPRLARKLSTNIPRVQRRTIPTSFHQPTINFQLGEPFNRESIRHLAMSVDFNDRDILPDTVKPINYDISIYDIELGGDFSYQGTVSILSKVVKSSKEIVLNSHQLKIHSAVIQLEHTKTQQALTASEISYDAPRQRVTLSFPEEIPPSEKALIVLKFQGTINNDMAGFYRSKYKPAITPTASVPKDGEHHVMLSTQFESCDARRAFPCFDEPNLKATFNFEIELPEDQVALSNMPEKAVKKGKDGFKVVSFERTPIMSTYLLAWAVGDFEWIEDFTKRTYGGKHLPVRVYTTRGTIAFLAVQSIPMLILAGLKNQAKFALEHAPQIIDYFSEIFEIDYPLPKCDLLAVHEFVSIPSDLSIAEWSTLSFFARHTMFPSRYYRL